MGNEIYMSMIGPSDFNIIGSLNDWDVMDRLTEIAVPTLLVAGRYDECRPDHMKDMHERIPHSEFVLFEDSAHMPFFEEPDIFFRALRDFLVRSEAHALKPSGPGSQ
ncbi:alpha/beta fold hydrolase [Rhodococcus jostii]|uniref:alpha/beta fold hydrolase n=1 Tax=Rhodococcus jostii TaxID=132919 RepID=UPI00362BAB86